MAWNEVPRDVPNERYVYFSDGGYAKLMREDPYGLIYIYWNKGPTPTSLSGSYTSYEKATIAIQQYLGTNTKARYATVAEEQVEVAPPIKYKKIKYKGPEGDPVGPKGMEGSAAL